MYPFRLQNSGVICSGISHILKLSSQTATNDGQNISSQVTAVTTGVMQWKSTEMYQTQYMDMTTELLPIEVM